MDAQSEKLLAQIIRNTRVAALATLRDEASRISMVAYIVADDFSAFYFFLSKLAQHTIDMQKDRHISMLITENDDGRIDPQTLGRVAIRGSAEMLFKGEPGFTTIKAQYLARFPHADVFLGLDDFNFWRITPRGGRFVAGLAKAYNITFDTLVKVSART